KAMASTDDRAVPGRIPAVSVCVPLYQKRTYIGDTVRSVLSQTFTDFELVVLDNASRDGSGDVVKAFDDPRIVLRRNDETISATVLRRVVRHGGNPVGNPGNVLFRRSAFEAAGGFPTDEDFFTADVSMWLRLLDHGRYLGLPETLTSFRIDGGSHTLELRREA